MIRGICGHFLEYSTKIDEIWRNKGTNFGRMCRIPTFLIIVYGTDHQKISSN
jgi:hypothetical protein